MAEEDSIFNMEEFCQQPADGAFSTTIETMPVNDYTAQIESFKVKKIFSKKDNTPFHVMEIQWGIDAPDIAEQLGRTKLTARQSLFIDVEGTPPRLIQGKGKNVQLGRLLEALGQNGRAGWTPNMLNGATAKVHVETDVQKDGRKFDIVTGVAPL